MQRIIIQNVIAVGFGVLVAIAGLQFGVPLWLLLTGEVLFFSAGEYMARAVQEREAEKQAHGAAMKALEEQIKAQTKAA